MGMGLCDYEILKSNKSTLNNTGSGAYVLF